MTEEKRIYVVVAGTIKVPLHPDTDRPGVRTVVQPIGRQVAQACHATAELRLQMTKISVVRAFARITTIVLQARDSAEMCHVYDLLNNKKLEPVLFGDENPEYGPGRQVTALAVYASPSQVYGLLDYLPLWGAK